LGGTEGILQIINDITERKTAIEKIVQMATHDALTGLPNRTLLMDRLGQAFASADRNGDNVVLMFIDLDQFKTVNDSL
jgi:diguanylate cyclase (GGDEF)-like protein